MLAERERRAPVGSVTSVSPAGATSTLDGSSHRSSTQYSVSVSHSPPTIESEDDIRHKSTRVRPAQGRG